MLEETKQPLEEAIQTSDIDTEQKQRDEDLKKIREMLADPTVKVNALAVAKDLQEKMHDNWFGHDRLIKKGGFDSPEQAVSTLNLLCAIGYCYQKRGEKGEMKFKITINIPSRIRLLNDQVMEAEANIAIWKAEIKKLNEQQNTTKSKQL